MFYSLLKDRAWKNQVKRLLEETFPDYHGRKIQIEFVEEEGMKVVQTRYEVFERPAYEYHNSKDVYQCLKDRFDPIQERFYLMPIVGQEFDIEELFAGGTNSTTIDPKIIFHRLITKYPNTSSFFIAHNHPQGNLFPSGADKDITKLIMLVCKTMGYHLVDHLIFDNKGFYSFFDERELYDEALL